MFVVKKVPGSGLEQNLGDGLAGFGAKSMVFDDFVLGLVSLSLIFDVKSTFLNKFCFCDFGFCIL